ncbi:MAG: hypothetical protein ACI4F4_04980 [Lachnospiraceae bacterium]
MTTLWTFRDNAKTIYSRYDYIFTPILKFILSFLVIMNINSRTGYMAFLNQNYIVFLLSILCAFLPIEFLAGISFVVLIGQSFKTSLDACLLGVILILIFYFGYMRFVPKTGVLVFLVPIFQMLHLTYAIPVLFGFLFGPSAMVAVAFGLIVSAYETELGELVNVLAKVSEDDEAIQGYQYILSELLANKQMMLTMLVFAVVILITYLIYRLPFEHSWIVSFFVGGILNIVLFLMGSVMFLVEVDLMPVLIGSGVSVLIAIVIQFFKGVLDYQRTELLQFEDDDYYYYVKAIPKLSISEKKANVKHINSKTNK